MPRFRLLRGFSHKRDQTLARVPAVLFLGAKTARIDDENSIPGNPAAAQSQQAPANIFRQGSRAGDIESKLDGGRHTIDILAAGT